MTPAVSEFDLNAQPPDLLRRVLLDPMTRAQAGQWVDQGKLKAPSFGIDFLKALAYEPDYADHPWIAEFRRTGPDGRWPGAGRTRSACPRRAR